MKNKSYAFWGIAFSSGFLLSACSHQVAEPTVSPVATIISKPLVPRVVVEPPVVVKSPKIVRVQPVPYRDIVIAPVQLQPVPDRVIPPAPMISPLPLPVAAALPETPAVPKVKAKGAYHGAVPVDDTLRDQYQQ